MRNIIGKIVYVDNGLYKVIDCYEGDENLSYHGSASYEKFIVAERLSDGTKATFGSKKYEWRIAEEYIRMLEKRREVAKEQCEKLLWEI